MRTAAVISVLCALLHACADGDGRALSGGGVKDSSAPGQPLKTAPGVGEGSASGGEATGGSGGVEGGEATGDEQLETVSWGGTPFRIFKYEASIVDGKAASVASAVPKVSIDYAGAKAACEAGGYRICTLDEWLLACKGPEQKKFAYADTAAGPPAVEEACDTARTTNNTPGSLPSAAGSHADCKTKGTEIFDMVGNASEWADDDGTPVSAGVAFYQPAAESHCEQTLTGGGATMDPGTVSSDVGFRCCADAAAP